MAHESSDRRLRNIVLGLVVAITVVRVYLSAVLGLGDDEAYYWHWSRMLSLSYFDHPGMVAWLIRLSTTVLGQTPLGVRFPNLLCNTLSGFVFFRLSREMFSERVAWRALFLYYFSPIFVLGGLLMVPDSPMGLAWMICTWVLWRIERSASAAVQSDGCAQAVIDLKWLWLIAGLALGFGLVSKYTVVLLAVSALLLFASTAHGRKLLRTPGFWFAVTLASICCAPILIWNAQYDWPSLRFHLQERQSGGGGANFTRWSQFFITQAIALGPALFLVCVATLAVAWSRLKDVRWRVIAWVTSPLLILFTVQALFAEFKPHWPAPAYPLLILGACQLWQEGFGLRSQRSIQAARVTLTALVLVLVVPLVLIFHVGAVVPILPKIARWGANIAHAPLNWDPKFDPTNDLYGWPEVASHVRSLQEDAVIRGEARPFLASSRYQLVAQLAFASGENVERVVQSRDQYTFTQTPSQWKPLVGQNALYVDDQRFERDPRNDHMFTSCDKLAPFIFKRDSETARIFNIWSCHSFKGFGT
jgi:hypothetical protein